MKIFSHRGLRNGQIKENSLKAFKQAYEKNLRAFEVDIWYLENELFLTHDKPQDLNNLNKLEELFSEFQNEVSYWLDFKNLTEKNCKEVCQKMQKIMQNFGLNSKQLYFAPYINNLENGDKIYPIIKEIFGNEVQILAIIEKIDAASYQDYYQKFKAAGLYGISIHYSNLNGEFRKFFSDVPIFAWTVNEQKIAQSLEKLGIENLTSDYLTTI